MKETEEQYKKRVQGYFNTIMGAFGTDIEKTAGKDKFKKAFESTCHVKVKNKEAKK